MDYIADFDRTMENIYERLEKYDQEYEDKLRAVDIEIQKSLSFCANHTHCITDNEMLAEIDRIKKIIEKKALIK